ncbi:unnamed protein product [Discosporangium mesarthrocarpum]
MGQCTCQPCHLLQRKGGLTKNYVPDHCRPQWACSGGDKDFAGDKTIIPSDRSCDRVKYDERYTSMEYTLVDSQGREFTEKAAYLIVDGGYHKWRCLMCPFKASSTQAQLMWSNWLESVRKDVECYLGD